MIDTVGLFLIRHVKQHVGRILITFHPYLAGILALGIAFNEYDLGSHFSVDQNFSVFQNYDSVVFGFTATAMAIMLTISSGRFLQFISSKEIDGRTGYRAAAFVLSWNSFAHLTAFMFVFIAKNSLLWQNNIFVEQLNTRQRVCLAVVLWAQFYAFFQFIVTTLTLFEISDLFGTFLQNFGEEENEEG